MNFLWNIKNLLEIYKKLTYNKKLQEGEDTMKIEEKRIKKFVGSAALMTALTLGGIVAIN